MYLYNIVTIFLYKNLFIRNFIYSEINTCGLPKLSKLRSAFNIFVLIPVQEMVYLKVIQKIMRMDISVSVSIGQKPYLKIFLGGIQPPYPPGSAYETSAPHWSVISFQYIILILTTVIVSIFPPGIKNELVTETDQVLTAQPQVENCADESQATAFVMIT